MMEMFGGGEKERASMAATFSRPGLDLLRSYYQVLKYLALAS